MLDPFATGPAETKSTAPMFIPSGAVQRPLNREWTDLATTTVQGFKASSWIYTCITTHSHHVSGLPWIVEEMSSAGEWSPVPDHDRALLIENPNDEFSRLGLMELMTLHLLLGGEAFFKVIRVGADREPVELWPLYPSSVTPIPGTRRWIDGWEVTERTGGRPQTWKADQVCMPKLTDPDLPHRGLSPLRAIGKVVDMDVRTVDWNRELIENDAAPAGVFVNPNIRDEADLKAVKKNLRQVASGPLHSREPLVLGPGENWIQLGTNPRDMDWIAGRKFTVGEICGVFAMLPHRFLGEAATFDNLSTAVRYEIQSGALVYARTIGEALSVSLLTRGERLGDRSRSTGPRRPVRIRPDTSDVPALRSDLHASSESFERYVGATVPPAAAASLLGLPLKDLRTEAFKRATLEPVDAPNPKEFPA